MPGSWKSKKKTAVSHSSTEAEIISLDAGLRVGGIFALTLWDLVKSHDETCFKDPQNCSGLVV